MAEMDLQNHVTIFKLAPFVGYTLSETLFALFFCSVVRLSRIQMVCQVSLDDVRVDTVMVFQVELQFR